MIKRNTVFILGAGASVPYGYPTGDALLKMISSLGSDQLFTKFLNDISVTESPMRPAKLNDLLDPFTTDLAESGLLSVDSFIVVKPQYAQICKFAITYLLLKIESDNRNSISENEDWYRHLYHNFIDKKSFEEILKSKVSFITFNYDVSLDGFFLKAINSKFPGQAETFFKNVEILHVHGKIRTLPWESNSITNTPMNFRFDMNKRFYVWNSSLGIRFAFDEAAQTAIQRARDLIQKAQNVYFLGFGFHADNMEKLAIDWMNELRANTHTQYSGTAFKLTEAEIRKIINDVHGFNERSGEILLKLEQKNCLDFIRSRADKI